METKPTTLSCLFYFVYLVVLCVVIPIKYPLNDLSSVIYRNKTVIILYYVCLSQSLLLKYL